MDLTLDTPARYVPHVGPVMAERLQKLGVNTVRDLLWHIPFRYDDFSLVSPIGQVQPGETVTVAAHVVSIRTYFTKTGKRVQEAEIADDTGTISVIWFNQQYLLRIIREGMNLRFSGKIDRFGRKVVLFSPVWEEVASRPVGDTGSDGGSLHTGRLVPVYAETEGLTSKWFRGRVDFLLHRGGPDISDPLPAEIRDKERLPALKEALETVHFPNSPDAAERARHRLAFDELLVLQYHSFRDRYLWESTKKAFSVAIPASLLAAFLKDLPFTLTGDQTRALSEILSDLSRSVPMNRILVGDVGSGKTVLAAIAMYAAVKSGHRAVLMAPTQILAEQHFRTISMLLSPKNIRVVLVTSDTKKTDREEGTLFGPAEEETVYVGTHALLAKSFRVKNIGLTVIDEQHRFGVEQRSALLGSKTRGKTPHFLTMTATPIPRTVARTMFGNIDLSVLNSMPGGRKRIKTWVVPKEKRDAAYDWIRKEISASRGQAFIICPLIEESESLTSVRAVTTEFKRLEAIFRGLDVGLLHGRMKPAQKSKALDRFRAGMSQILVATPVVEVGIDIPNATIMMIEASDRFGLGQLHQLRGRVGRGDKASYCLLFTDTEDESALIRLKSLETVYSGPELAEIDLKLRGPGDLFGTRQHGLPPLSIARFDDTATIEAAGRLIRRLTANDPELSRFPLLRQSLEERTIGTITND
ncbi:ATP-dependent DNA helicase RecG [Patescibacteria group bacterium]|nr:ATP-dependent DNA helicase RecG [Patescibacteria group bacterium]